MLSYYCVLLLVLLSLALPATSVRTTLLSRSQLSQQFSPLSASPLPHSLSSTQEKPAIDTPITLPATIDISTDSNRQPSPLSPVPAPVPSWRPVRRVWEDVLENSKGKFAARVEACLSLECATPAEKRAGHSIEPQPQP